VILVLELTPRSDVSQFIHHIGVFPLYTKGIWMEMRLGYGITASTYPIIDLHILTVVILENTHCSEQGPFPVEVMADI
jgi:hypothetical protein